ncbi:MAG: hypothetical protein IKV15_07200 [Bacteroidaceae bacterium]|nr:hypothetical protein [Bacteroidaceae bacterium]
MCHITQNDFFAPKKRKIWTREREVSSLLKVAKHVGAQRLTIVNEEQTIQVGNASIEVIPLWKWLAKGIMSGKQ